VFFLFFFSSRRRHTRFSRDWSSDVCSSDLIHAIAVLLGQVPASFRLGGGASLPAVPRVPVGVPSALLLRRPDVAGAERRVAQARSEERRVGKAGMSRR